MIKLRKPRISEGIFLFATGLFTYLAGFQSTSINAGWFMASMFIVIISMITILILAVLRGNDWSDVLHIIFFVFGIVGVILIFAFSLLSDFVSPSLGIRIFNWETNIGFLKTILGSGLIIAFVGLNTFFEPMGDG
jgi:hypothetical protein